MASAEQVRILIVEDLPTDAELARREIGKALPASVFQIVETREDYLRAVESFTPDIVVSDYRLPRFNGMEALTLAMQLKPLMPVIILTSAMTEDTAVECMKAGAADYVIKEHIKRLGQAVIHALEQARIRRERARAEESLHKSELAFRSLFNASPVGIALIVNRMPSTVNQAWCKITGYPPEEMQGHSIRKLFRTDQDFEYFGNEIYRRIAHTGIIALEVPARHKNGKDFDALVYVSPVDPQDPSAGIIATLIDITERKQAEMEKAKLQEQLNQAQKMESIGRLAGGVAHDFNNLLTAISGNTELALLGKPDAKITAHLNVVQKASASAAELTRQLLAFSRKQIIEQKVIDMGELIRDMGKMLSRLIGEDISLQSSIQPGLALVKVDPGQIQQIIMNLAVNARDAMPDGGTLDIAAANVMLDEAYCRQHGYTVPGEHVRLSVCDTGAGMTEEIMQHLFEPFFTTKSKGTGLGLATVYGAVKQNGGTIEVYSEPGQGTCFKIYFPKTSGEAETLAAVNIDGQPGGSETILLVEDNPMVLEFSHATLKTLGYTVLAASNAEEALTLAGRFGSQIRLLMTDVILPGMNGRQLSDILKSQYPELKVLFTSGYTEDTIVHHGVLEPNIHFIGKPFSGPALARKLRAVLESG